MLEISLRDTFDPTIVHGNFTEFVQNLNLAAVQGKQFIIATEARDDGDEQPVAFETRNITRVRPIEDGDALIGR